MLRHRTRDRHRSRTQRAARRDSRRDRSTIDYGRRMGAVMRESCLVLCFLASGCSPREADVGVGDAGLGDASVDAGTVPIDVACEHLFAATYATPCSGPALDDAEKVRLHDRWMNSCRARAQWPGSGWIGRAIDDCASEVDSHRCAAFLPPPLRCTLSGSLAVGEPCNDSSQCGCQPKVPPAPGGGGTPPHCGTCTVGGGGIGPSAIRERNVGESCDGPGDRCKQSLYCDPITRSCTPIDQGLGGPCTSTGDVHGTGCVAPHLCLPTTPGRPGGATSGTCSAPLAEGSPCYFDNQCAVGLGCWAATGLEADQRCSKVTWVEPSKPCDRLARCRVGGCRLNSTVSGECAYVIPDGQFCDYYDRNTTCDAFSECFDGKCTLIGSFACR